MNKKISAIFIVAILTLFPKTSRADLDVLSIAQDQITSITEKVNAIVKQYSTIQTNLQELSLNRNIVSQLKDKVKGELKAQASQFVKDVKDAASAESMMFLKTSLSSVTLPGIGQYIDLGGFVNPKLTVAVGKTYLKKQHQNNDVQRIVAQDERSNNLMVDNLAIIFSNSLVHRKQIIDEDPCSCVDGDGQDCSSKKQKCEEQEREFNEMSDVNVVKNKHFVTMLNANHRWLKIKEAVAQQAKMRGEGLMNQGNLDDVSAVTGEIDDTKEPEATEEEIKSVMGNRINPMDLSNSIKGGLDNIKNGNYTGVLSDALGTATDMYGNAPGSHENVTNLLKNATTGAEALNSALSGDWESAISNADNSANSVLSGTNNAETLVVQEENKRKCQECRNNARTEAESAAGAAGKTGMEAKAEIEMQVNMKCQLLCFGLTGL